MNPNKQKTCVKDEFSWSTTSGYGIPVGKCEINIHTVGNWRRPLQLNGLLVSEPESRKLGLLYGYLKYYGRNTTHFVMSRAARKRGYKVEDFRSLAPKFSSSHLIYQSRCEKFTGETQ